MKPYILSLALLVTACSATEPSVVAPHPVIQAHVDAFNAKDIAAMAAVEHPDIEWLSINGSDISTEVAGRDALSEMMEDYLKNNPSVKGTLRDWGVNGNYVSVTETARWTTKDGFQKSQSATTVYELEDNLIRRVWYYPAVTD